MNSDPADPLDAAATVVGGQYGMTASDLLLHAALGDIPHPDATPDVCGATDPRDAAYWCVLPPGHPRGMHSRYTDAEITDGAPTLWRARWDDATRRRGTR
jgi:hypothetical protein